MPYNSKIANKLLVTPFDRRACVKVEVSKNLTEEEFCKYCYSSPAFENKNKDFIDENSEAIENEFVIKTEEMKAKYYEQEKNHEYFCIWLENFNISKVYTITGNAGAGKTTFINYKRCTEKDINWIVLDIYDAPNTIEWMPDISTRINQFYRAQGKVYACILQKIQEEMLYGLDEDENYSIEKSIEKLEKVVNGYQNNYIKRYPSARTLFDGIKQILSETKQKQEKIAAVAKMFQEEFDGTIDKNNSEIDKALNVLLLVLLCKEEKKDVKYVLVFDNFERFIKSNELYNKDITEIRIQLDNYVERINRKGNCFREKFKFILSVRDGTARMCNGVSAHAADTAPSNLNLNGWYNVDDIIKKKKEWYRKEGIDLSNADLVEKIVGDLRQQRSDKTLTGLKLMLDPLFNNNKRLLIDFVGSMVERPDNKEALIQYEKLLNENMSKSTFAARSIIRGLVLDNIEKNKDHLFEHLKTFSAHGQYNGLGDARKILTILYNHIRNGEKNEMLVSEVLSSLFAEDNVESVWNLPEYAEKRKTISEIMYFMNSYNNRENDGIQFIEIQYKTINNKENSVIAGSASELENIITENMENCAIRLMPAGEVYLEKIVASFEFFSFRYCRTYKPLYMLVPTPDEIRIQRPEDLACYKVICRVTEYAAKCIKTLEAGEDSIRLNIGKGEGILHRVRIKNAHKAYIQEFASYIEQKYVKDNSAESIDVIYVNRYQQLLEKIREQLLKYN